MERIRKIALILLKLAGVALAVWLMKRTVQGVEGSLLSSLQGSVKPLIAMAVLCYGIVNFIASWRWKLLLEVQGMQVPLLSLFRLTMIGAFFSQIIPGSVSGDILKLAFVMKYGRNRGAEAALTIVVDRYIGLFGLFAVAALSCLFCLLKCPEVVMGNRVVLLAFVFVWSAFVGMPLAWYLVLARGVFMRVRPVAALCGYFSSHLPGRLNGLVARLAAAVDLHRNENIAVLKAFLMSCVIHSLLAFQIFLLGKAFHERVMTFLEYTVTAQLGNATGIIPITPGGMGVRDTVSGALLGVFGAEPLEALSLVPVTNTIILVLWSLVGAICLLTWNGGSAQGEDADDAARGE